MRILIATPAAGGQVTTQWMLSFIGMHTEASKISQSQSLVQHLEGAMRAAKEPDSIISLESFVTRVGTMPKIPFNAVYDIGLICLGNESLLGRGRNHLAQIALTGGWDKLFFIDADAGWAWQDAKALIDSKSLVIGGSCPLKIYVPNSAGQSVPPLNWKPLERDVGLFDPSKPVTVEGLEKLKAKYNATEVPVKFLGTAFLCIDRRALLKICETADHYGYPSSSTGQTETHWDFFKTSAIDNQYMSEDWGFCHQARQHGMEIMLNTDVIISHTGNHTFHAPRAARPIDSQTGENRSI